MTSHDVPETRAAFEIVSSPAFLRQHPGEWDGLVRSMSRPCPFFLSGWLAAWWDAFGENRRLELHVARENGRLVGLLPLMVPATGLRIAEFVGGAVTFGDVIVAGGSDSTARGLMEHAAARSYDGFDLYALPVDSAIARWAGRRLTLVDRVEAAVLEMPEGWEAAYRAKTTKQMRHQHGRKRRRLAELGTLHVSVARSLDELEPALEDGFRLHDLRWEGRFDRSDFGTREGRDFHRAALRALAAIDVPRIVTLTLDGRPIAFYYYFALAGRMYGHRTAFDPALAHYSPGVLTTHDAIQAASDEGLTIVEFLRGAERYKVEIADRLEPMFEALGMPDSIRGRARLSARAAALELRKRLRRSESLKRLYIQGLQPIRNVTRRGGRGS